MRSQKVWTLIMILLLPSAYAGYVYEVDCSQSNYNKGLCGPEVASEHTLVTGHTAYAKNIISQREIRLRLFDYGKPTDFAALAGFFLVEKRIDIEVGPQRECVVWFNGANIDPKPDPDNFNTTNDHVSDEDEDLPYDQSRQDYDFDREVEGCGPEILNVTERHNLTGAYAVAVERGDCNPHHGHHFNYRGHLDFIDPNGIYHEVQEYEYFCARWKDPYNGTVLTREPERSGSGNRYPIIGSDAADIFYDMVPGSFDDRFADQFKERLWITRIHYPVYDATIGEAYTFAMVVDTCDTRCTDGSSGSFDDTNRGSTVHSEPPSKVEDIMRGNSIGGNGTANSSYPTTPGKHREHCRGDMRWQVVKHPPDTNSTTCYKEDHKTAQVDLYIFEKDPTSLFNNHNRTAPAPHGDSLGNPWSGNYQGGGNYTSPGPSNNTTSP